MAAADGCIDVPFIVWGSTYVGPFLQLTLPSLLADGNIPALAKISDLRFNIFTTSEDSAVIQNHPSIHRLMSYGPVVVKDIGSIQKFRRMSHYDLQTHLFGNALADAEKIQAGLLFLAPDVIVANGSLSSIHQMTEAGARAVVLPCVRAKKYALLTEITEKFGIGATPPREISITGTELSALTLRHLHPLTACHIVKRNSDNCFVCKAPLFNFPVGSSGLLVRSFIQSPALIFPRNWPTSLPTTIDLMDLPSACGVDQDEVVAVSDSDDALIVEFSDLSDKGSEVSAPPASLEEVTDWLGRMGLPFHLQQLKFTFRLHSDAIDEALWSGTQDESDRLAIEILGNALKLIRSGLAANLADRYAGNGADHAMRSAE